MEIAQALRRYVLHGTPNEGMGALALDRWRNLDAERSLHEPFLAYDAIHVALAESLSTVLVTGDRRLAGASEVRAAIEVI